jgi:hypothetical protein
MLYPISLKMNGDNEFYNYFSYNLYRRVSSTSIYPCFCTLSFVIIYIIAIQPLNIEA